MQYIDNNRPLSSPSVSMDGSPPIVVTVSTAQKASFAADRKTSNNVAQQIRKDDWFPGKLRENMKGYISNYVKAADSN